MYIQMILHGLGRLHLEMHMYTKTHMCVYEPVVILILKKPEEDVGAPETGVSEGSKATIKELKIDSGNSPCSKPLSHLS